MKTLLCKKCGYIATFDNEEEKQKHILTHSNNCNGILEEPDGRCLQTTLMNSINNPKVVFCYTFLPGKIKGQKFIHAWNEVRVINKDNSIKIINFGDKEGKEYLYKDVGGKIKLSPKKESYHLSKIKEKQVKRFSLKEVLQKMTQCLDEEKDVWEWLNR